MKPSGPRHSAREYALRELYSQTVLKNVSVEPLPPIANWWGKDDRLVVPREAFDFARSIIDGIQKEWKKIDALIQNHAKNWRLDRMPIVDRNLLRLSTWELLHHPETPSSVILNEALELAKCYGNDDSPRFVNGILDPLAKSIRDQHEKSTIPKESE